MSRLALFPGDGSLPSAIGPYRVLHLLGNGGMAVVYRVAGPTGDALALKLPRPEILEDPEFVARFRREMALGRRLRHPNLVRIVDVNADDHPYPYLVMEVVSGRPLGDCFAAGTPLDVATAVAVAGQVLSALEPVHAAGIVHRDIKPGNVMVADGWRVTLMDFGIARQGDGTCLTRTDEMLGTPLYMAPEQLEARLADPRSDLYAVGTLLYEMLAGITPYTTPNRIRLILEKLKQDPPPLARWRPSVPPALQEVVMRLLERDPARRPASAAAVREALERCTVAS